MSLSGCVSKLPGKNPFLQNYGKGGGKPIVFDSTLKTVRDADQTDLDWLKERKIEGARVIVMVWVSPSSNYRTRSHKTLGPGSAGALESPGLRFHESFAAR